MKNRVITIRWIYLHKRKVGRFYITISTLLSK